jgi:UDP-glucose 4-epimerase
VLFTGGAGFIGMHVLPMLLERGYRVRLLDSMTHRANRDKLDPYLANDDVELIEQDVRYGDSVQRAMKGVDSVIHFATVSINKSITDPSESVDINMVGNHNVFAAAAAEGVRRLVFASSASVYGEPDSLPMREEDVLKPQTPYCIGKRAGEDMLGFYQRQAGLSWIALRFFNVYGPGQKTSAYYTSVINHFVNRLRNGEPPIIDGKGEQTMDFVHVHDVARAVVMALDCEQDGVPINIGTGVQTSLVQLANILIDSVGVNVEAQFQPRDVLVTQREADISRAREVLGWQPTITVDQGLKELVQDSL